MTDMQMETLSALAGTLTAYRNLRADPAAAALMRLMEALSVERPLTGADDMEQGREPATLLERYGAFLSELFLASPGADLHAHLLRCALLDENPFTAACMRGPVPEPLQAAAEHDLSVIRRLCLLSPGAVKRRMGDFGIPQELLAALPAWSNAGTDFAPADMRLAGALANTFGHDWADTLVHEAATSRLSEAFARFHRKNGSGLFVGHHGFTWDCRGGECSLTGIGSPDPIRLSDFVGYEAERAVVTENTRMLLDGLHANNVLLYGARGTGKSSTVKALLNEYGERGLRVVELTRTGLEGMPILLRRIAGQPLRFILFIDDLAFEGAEDTYTPLKAMIEGGLESRPCNAVIYATSNRRHLVKERFSERSAGGSADPDDDVRAMDARQEKLSLADRFGITVTFQSPDQETYLVIAEELVKAEGVAYDPQELRREALRWELHQNVRSPRTARQFANWYAGHAAK